MSEGVGGEKVPLTYDRHTSQWGDERRWGEAVGGKVPQFPGAHQEHAAPPHHRGVVGLGASLSLTDVGIFLPREDRKKRGGIKEMRRE